MDVLVKNHFIQGGYDFEFVDDISPYECSICLLCLRDPYQTSCGHRFCHSCILTWVDSGKTCPKDNASIVEGDIFPDPGTRRDVMQLVVHCPWTECSEKVRLCDIEKHLSSCTQRTSSPLREENCQHCGENVSKILSQRLSRISNDSTKNNAQHKLVCPLEPVACAFASAGCIDRIPRSQLSVHNESYASHHLQLLWEKILKIQQIMGASNVGDNFEGHERRESESLVMQTLERGNALRSSGSNLHSLQKCVENILHQMISLDQKIREVVISNEVMKKAILKLQNSVSNEQELLARVSNGEFVWKVENFSGQFKKMRRESTIILYSNAFYTSVFGYKMCLRCNVYPDNDQYHLSLFVHLMKGINDDSLQWPFEGKIVLRLINQKFNKAPNHCTEKMDAPQGLSDAFRRPVDEMNKVGFGLRQFVSIDTIFEDGFLVNDSILVKAFVVADNDMVKKDEDI